MDLTALLTLLCLTPWFAEPLPELMHLPGPDAVRASIEAGERHKAWVYEQYMNPPCVAPMDPYWRAWLEDCGRCLHPWHVLAEAQSPWLPVERRYLAAERLRELLGEERWWRGQLGAPVPLERFTDTPHPVLPPISKGDGKAI